MSALACALGESLRTYDIVGIAERRRARHIGSQLRRLGMQRLQPGHIRRELAQHFFRVDGHLLLEQ